MLMGTTDSRSIVCGIRDSENDRVIILPIPTLRYYVESQEVYGRTFWSILLKLTDKHKWTVSLSPTKPISQKALQ